MKEINKSAFLKIKDKALVKNTLHEGFWKYKKSHFNSEVRTKIETRRSDEFKKEIS